jgi:hypothetical protein
VSTRDGAVTIPAEVIVPELVVAIFPVVLIAISLASLPPVTASAAIAVASTDPAA